MRSRSLKVRVWSRSYLRPKTDNYFAFSLALALPNAVRNAGARGLTDDTARTAREITAMVAEYYVKNGGQLSGKEQKPKMLAHAQ